MGRGRRHGGGLAAAAQGKHDEGPGHERAYVYLATGVILGQAHPEPAEVITVHTLSAAEALRMARAGEINDAASVMALLLAEKEL